MQDEATEARNSDIEPVNADQQTTSAVVSDGGTETPSSSTVIPSSSLSNDEIANGYRWGSRGSFDSVAEILDSFPNHHDETCYCKPIYQICSLITMQYVENAV